MQKTTVILRELSADEQIREEARRREKRLHDEATALNHARKEERTSIAAKMCQKDYTEEQIKDLLGE